MIIGIGQDLWSDKDGGCGLGCRAGKSPVDQNSQLLSSQRGKRLSDYKRVVEEKVVTLREER